LGTMLNGEAAPVNSAGEEGRMPPVPVAVPIGTVAVPIVEGIG
jgi:hypothetical protein